MNNYKNASDTELNALCAKHVIADQIDQIVADIEVEVVIENDSDMKYVLFFGGSRIEAFDDAEKANNSRLSFLNDWQKIALEVDYRANSATGE